MERSGAPLSGVAVMVTVYVPFGVIVQVHCEVAIVFEEVNVGPPGTGLKHELDPTAGGLGEIEIE